MKLKENDQYKYIFCLSFYVFVLFLPSLFYPVMNYDTQNLIINNDFINSGLSFRNIEWAFSFQNQGSWLPVRWISHMLDFSLFGFNYVGHKFTNLFIHICNVYFLFMILMRITKRKSFSFLIAILFGIHPIQVESVVWIMGRKDILSTFFGLLSIRCYLWSDNKFVKHIFSSFLLLLSLLSKPTYFLMMPFLLLFLESWRIKEINFISLVKLIKNKTVFFIMIFIVVFINLYLINASTVINNVDTIIKYANIPIHYLKYIHQTFYPENLIIFYPYQPEVNNTEAFFSFLIIAVISYLSVRLIKKERAIAIGWMWFLCLHIPTIGFIKIGPQAIANRYHYLPIIGLIIFFTAIVDYLITFLKMQKVMKKIILFLILITSFITNKQIKVWRDPFSVWSHAIEKMPENEVAYYNLGSYLYQNRNDKEKALVYLLKALKLNTAYYQLHYTLAHIYTELNKYNKAIDHYKMGLQLHPINIEYYNLGTTYLRNNNLENAVSMLQKYLQLAPSSSQSYHNLGLVYDMKNNHDKAICNYKKAVNINPNLSESYYNLANIYYFDKNDVNQAVKHLKRCLEINSQDLNAKELLSEIARNK